MASNTGFKSIQELVKDLSGKVEALTGGTAQVKDIEKMCVDTRELYERLVVLRHRGREAVLAGSETITLDETKKAPAEPVAVEAPKQVEPETVTPPAPPIEKPVAPQLVPEMTLDFSPEPPAERTQTTVVEPVAETKEVASVEEEVGSIAEKLESAPIEDLGKAIGLNQKFMFISKIFKGNKDAFASAIEKLNTASGREQALSYTKELTAHLVEGEEELQAKEQFVDLIERRFS